MGCPGLNRSYQEKRLLIELNKRSREAAAPGLSLQTSVVDACVFSENCLLNHP